MTTTTTLTTVEGASEDDDGVEFKCREMVKGFSIESARRKKGKEMAAVALLEAEK